MRIIRIVVQPPIRMFVYPRLTLEDIQRIGFSKTGNGIEMYDSSHLSRLVRKWTIAKAPKERVSIEGVIALGGWFRPPLTDEEMLKKYPRRGTWIRVKRIV